MVKVISTVAILLIYVFACSPVKVRSTNVKDVELGMKSYEVSGIKVFTSLSGVSEDFRTELNRKGIKRAVLINGGQIDVKNNYTVQKAKIQAYLDKAVPPNADALVIIDIEGEKLAELGKGPTSTAFAKTLAYYTDVYKFTKKCRPNATVGIYGLPWRDYWNRTDAWRAKNETLLPLLKEVDALFPSIYDFYRDDLDVKRYSDSAYVSDNAIEALRIAELCSKPVYPLVWHRYHSSNKKAGREIINKTEFQNHIEALASARYKEKKVDGLVWWSSERYFYNASPKGLNNKGNPNAFERYSNKYGLEYLDVLLEGLERGSQN